MSEFSLSDALTTKAAASPLVSPPNTVLDTPEHREFNDVGAMRNLIFDGVADAAKTAYPIENTRHRLELVDTKYADTKPFTLADQKKSIMRGTSLSRRLMGTWNLYDKETNELLDTKKTTVAHVPYATDRGTFIYKGNEYTIANQMRLKSGIYTRVKDNGVIEAHVNTRGGTGPSFRVYMEPDTGIMRMAVGQSTLKMYPIMRAMGASDKEIEKYWGREILQANVAAEDPRAVSRAFSKLVNTRLAMEEMESNSSKKIAQEEKFLNKVANYLADLAVDTTGGLDPSGSITFQTGLKDKGDDFWESVRHMVPAVAGGFAGGSLVIPALSLGAIRAIPALLRGRFSMAGRAFRSGTTELPSNIIKGIRARQILSKQPRGKPYNKIQLAVIRDAASGVPVGQFKNMTIKSREGVPYGQRTMSRKMLKHIDGALAQNIGVLGVGGLIGGSSAASQYTLGREANRQFQTQKAGSASPTIAVDLDGTLAKHFDRYDPKSIPDPRPGARAGMRDFKKKGWKLIIWTVRGNKKLIKDWLKEHDIPYDYINENPSQPSGASEKIIADMYIDDRGLDARQSWNKIRIQAKKDMEKSAKMGAQEGDRKWTKLWFTGTIKAERGKGGKPWVYLEVHRGLVDSAFHSLKSEGIRVERTPNDPHITLLQGSEAQSLIKRFGETRWQGGAKDGMQVRFALTRLVNLIPSGWADVDRVWFIEVDSPGLQKYRKDLGFTPLPKSEETGHTHRFHITFAVHRPKTEVKRAAYLFGEKRAALAVGEAVIAPRLSDHGQGLLDTFNKMGLDPDVTESTIGARHENVSIPVLLRTSQKLLNISRGEEEIDDRDSLAYQTFHGPEDFFAERIRKDSGQVGRKSLWKSTLRGNVQHIPSGSLSGQLAGVLLRSGMGMPIEETNPMDIFDQNLRVLRLGEGGIGSLDAVPEESRNVQPSQFGYVDPIRAPESSKIGIDSRVVHGTVKGRNGQLYTRMHNAKTKKPSFVSAQQASKSVIAFPGELDSERDKVRAMVNSKQVEYVDRASVDYELPNPNQMFTATSNVVPLTSGIKGGRLLMGAKYITQALPLKAPESPLVQNLADDSKSFDDIYGSQVGAIRATDRGVVRSIDKNGITVVYAGGKKTTHELYDNFPFNRKTFIHNTPAVKVGDTVDQDQLLAKSNYTDENGTLAIGNNLRVAYMPYKGLNYEDAVVISETGAKKMASEHMYQNVLEGDDNREIGRKGFISLYPTKFDKKQLATMDERGVVKTGTRVQLGDPLLLSVDRAKRSAVHKGHKALYSDSSVVWNHDAEGVVTDVDQMDDKGWNVTVRAYMPMKEGDKLAGRYGDKGVVARIIPDDQMIHGADGKPYELLLNSQGIISRGNPAQVAETLLAKVARKRGKAYRVPSFMKENMLDYVQKELSRNGLKDTEDLYDPTDGGRKIPKILTGERFVYKLHHTAESKGRGRDIGAYTSEGLPAKGGEFGAKRVSNMEQNSLVSHGATEVLRDAQVVRGQRNDDYWRAFRLGYSPPSPKVPFVYEKMLGMLTAAGINVKKDGNSMNLFALTDKDIDKMSTGAVELARTVEHDDLKEISKGLFDRGLTGGHGGSRWSHIELAEPMPNPVMEEPIRRLLGLTKKKFEAILSGEESFGDKTGGQALRVALKNINLDNAISHHSEIVRNGPKSRRDNSVKSLGYLKTLQKNDMRPEDWMLTKAPVLPPHFRPITKFKEIPLVADPNYLYQDMIRVNNDLKEMTGLVGEGQMGRERLKLYNAFKAVTGLGDPIQAKTQEKNARGLLKHVFGSSPKHGIFQRRVMGSPVDIVGRATITPNPDLSMDQVGLPESKAWTIYRPFIMRRLIRRGMPAMQAAREVADQSDRAKGVMLEEMKDRPVLINRAPTMHRYGFMAAWPVLTKGETLQISPVVTEGFGADFDGDAMNYHVPGTDEAVQDAVEKMLPSKNLKAVRDFKVHYLPRQEFLLGLHLASSSKSEKTPRVFRSKEDVIKAHQRGEINMSDPVIISG